MRRPRLALWIKWHRLKWQRPWYCPNWLWLWAVRRVDRWHDWGVDSEDMVKTTNVSTATRWGR